MEEAERVPLSGKVNCRLNSQLLDIFSVADVDADECVNDNLVEILNLNLCQKISKIKFGF